MRFVSHMPLRQRSLLGKMRIDCSTVVKRHVKIPMDHKVAVETHSEHFRQRQLHS